MEKLYGLSSSMIALPEKLEIPIISNKRLKELYQLLKPIVTIDEIKYLLREFTLQELNNYSYIWNSVEDKRDMIDSNQLEKVDDFICLHTYGYYGFFKPSIAEILAQTPENVIEQANFFEIIEKPETREDVFKYENAAENGFHLSKVRAYRMHQ